MKIGGISGDIASLSPRVPIVVAGSNGTKKSFNALLDTGFDGVVSISREESEELGIRRLGEHRSVLADGTVRIAPIFAGRVLFVGEWRDVPITTSGDVALIGMQLIYGSRLTLDVFLDGDVDSEFVGDRRLTWDLT